MFTNSALPPSIDQFEAEGGHAPLAAVATVPLSVQVQMERKAQSVRSACQAYVLQQISKGQS